MRWDRRRCPTCMITRHLIREYGRRKPWEWEHGQCRSAESGARGHGPDRNGDIRDSCKGDQCSRHLPICCSSSMRWRPEALSRLGRTIQLTDTGIQPGSGVGNHRGSTDQRDSLGIPVIAIGVPTVVEAAAIIYDAQGSCERMPPHLNGMFVTPKNIDETHQTVELYVIRGI